MYIIISDETKERLRQSHLGNKHSKATRKKMSESRKRVCLSKGMVLRPKKKLKRIVKKKVVKITPKVFKAVPETRVCRICGVEKPIGSFYKVNGRTCHWKTCKDCYNEERREMRKKSDDFKRAQREALAEQARIPSPEEVAVGEAKARASVGRRRLKSYEEYNKKDKMEFFRKRIKVDRLARL